MAQQAKIFARVFDYSVPDASPASTMRFTIEWKMLRAPFEQGKFPVIVNNIVNDSRLKDDLRDALATYLAGRFPTEGIRPRDIVGYSI